jgi:hypothetical protein
VTLDQLAKLDHVDHILEEIREPLAAELAAAIQAKGDAEERWRQMKRPSTKAALAREAARQKVEDLQWQSDKFYDARNAVRHLLRINPEA